MLDIDFFKIFNDTYGHVAGDQCLKKVATATQEEVKRPGDFLARYGGEEFVIVLPNTDKKGAKDLSEQIRRKIQSLKIPHEKNSPEPIVTVSLGYTTLIPNENKSPKNLIEFADKALYQAKNNGRNRIEFVESIV